MKRSSVQSMVVALALASTMGCQSMSMPHLAWWKHDKPADVAATTWPTATTTANAPTLPSTQAKPQAVAAAGITPATPPSSANLAAAQPTTPAHACLDCGREDDRLSEHR